jgi:hypothetical protein
MHRSAVLGFALSFALLAACGGEDIVRGRQKTGGLSAADYNRLVDLNRMVQDNIDAREAVHNMITPMLNEKSKPMSEKIATPFCIRPVRLPDNDLTGAIVDERVYSPSGTCPINWFRRRGWTVANKTMVIIDNLEILDTEYRKKYARMAMRSMSGDYQIVPQSNGRNKVAGTILINDFQTIDHGRITGSVAIDYRPSGIDGTGTVAVSLSGNRWASSGSVSWRVRNGATANVTYRVNGVQIDKAEFDQLFSSFELDKHMENAVKML